MEVEAELMTVASALRGLPTHGDQSIAESATQELAVLFESLSAMLARSASASASMAAISAGAMASAALPSSPYKTLSSSSPTLTPYGGTVLPKLTAEHSFLTISREVEALRKYAAQTLRNSSNAEPSLADYAGAAEGLPGPRPYLDDQLSNAGPELFANMALM